MAVPFSAIWSNFVEKERTNWKNVQNGESVLCENVELSGNYTITIEK